MKTGIDFTFEYSDEEKTSSYKLTITEKLFKDTLEGDLSKAFNLFKEMALKEGAIQERKRIGWSIRLKESCYNNSDENSEEVYTFKFNGSDYSISHQEFRFRSDLKRNELHTILDLDQIKSIEPYYDFLEIE